MTQTETKPRESFWAQLRDDPATTALMDSVKNLAVAQAGNVAARATDKVSGKEGTGDGVGGAVDGVAKAANEGKGKIGTLWGGVKGAVKGLFSGPPGRSKAGRAAKRPTNIIEDVWIGAPVDVVYDEWTNYEKHAAFMKGVESVSRDAEGKDSDADESLKWTAKIWWSRRTWKSKVVNEEPEHRIRWTAEAPKGAVEGVITFTRLADNLTLVLVVIEYRGKGLIEWLGNRWRAAGRRVRLDLKHFRRHVMLLADENDDVDDDMDEVGEGQPGDDAAEGGDDSEEPSTEDDEDVEIPEVKPVKPVKSVDDVDLPDEAEEESKAEPEAENRTNGPRKPRAPREPEPAKGAGA